MASGPVFMFCAPGRIFDGNEGVRSHFHVLRSHTRFWRYRWRRVPFTCFALSDSFPAILRASGPVFMFCSPGLIFVGIVGVWSRFLVFALPNPFLAVPTALVPVFMFCAPGPIWGGTDGFRSLFHVLRSYRGRRVSFSCFALPDPFSAVSRRRFPFLCFAVPNSFSAVPRASGAVFRFCARGFCFGGTEGDRFCFTVLRSRTRFRRYRGHQVTSSCFSLPDPFSLVPSSSGPIFMFCATVIIFGGNEGVRSHFLVLRSQNRFQLYRGRRVPFSCFVLLEPFSAITRASGLVFMFCAPRPVFGGTEASGPVIMFCAPRLIFGGIEGVGCGFHVLRSRIRFRRCRGRQVPCFALPDPFSLVPSSSGLVFMFCAPAIIFGGNESVGSRFLVLRSQTRFLRYRARQVPFSCFALPHPFWVVPTTSVPVFMFCPSGIIFGGIKGVGCGVHVLRSRTRFRPYRGRRVWISCFAH
jgi:hypothetical protein